MVSGTLTLIIIGSILVAILADLWLLRRARQFTKKYGLATQGVHLFGTYSPLLTWLKFRFKPNRLNLQTSQAEITLDEPATQSTGQAVPARETVTAPKAIEDLDTAPTSRRWILLDLGLIVLAVYLFCISILDLGKPTRLPGNESDVFQALDATLVTSLREFHSFPLWNPFLSSGLPYIADPMLHVFNPVSTIPVLLLGEENGFKVGIFLSFLLAALGMWWLGGVLGMSRPARLYAALLYAFAGQPVARFFQGQYLFVLGFAWIPWTVGSLFLLVKTRRRAYWATTAFSLAMLFFSGNVYYSFYMLILIVLVALIYITKFQRRRPFLVIDRKLAGALLITGALSLGVIAVQLFPLVEFWPRLEKSLEVAGAHSLRQIYLDYTSADSFRPDAFSVLPAREEFYAYIGKIPFLALVLLPFYFLWKRDRKPGLIFGLMLGFVLVWIDLNAMPWKQAFLDTKVLLQFRHLLRILIYGGFAIILLGAFGIDTAWKVLAAWTQRSATTLGERTRVVAANFGLIALGALVLVGVGNVYQTNHQYIQTQPSELEVNDALLWLKGYDLSDYYIRLNPDNLHQNLVVADGLRFIEVWYHFGDIRNFDGMLDTRLVQARPKYIIQLPQETPPDSPGATLIHEVNGYDIYKLPANLPYAFTVSKDQLNPATSNTPLQREDVSPQTTFTSGPNEVEVIADAQDKQVLVVLTTGYPGWELRVDGRPQKMINVGGYLAAELLPGVHNYSFTFIPRSFFLGLIISLFSSLFALGMLIADTKLNLKDAILQLRTAPEHLRGVRTQLKEKFSSSRMITEAVYQEGKLLPEASLDLEENSRVHVVVELPSRGLVWRRFTWASADLVAALVKAISLTGLLSAFAMVIYAITRFYALERFPIYYFGDEAVQSLFAEDLIAHHFHGLDGRLFPIYVEAAANRWTPLLSMYFHALTMTLFGKSILVSRGTSAAVSLLGAAAVGLILHKVFKARYAWAGVLLLAVTPAWFLHSRTAFETVMTTAFYACFLLFYLLYRTESPRYIYPAIVFGAATFYSYSNAQAIILAAAGLLFISDIRYHLRNRDVLLRGLALALLLAIPFIEFRLSRPQAISEHLRTVGSYWYSDVSLGNKILLFAQKYLYGLSPQYWFISNSTDLPRHRMLGFGQMQTLVFPLVFLGLAICIAKWRSSEHRAVILVALATPVGAALVDVGIARVLCFVIPANLLAALGLEWLLERLKKWVPYRLAAWVLFLTLAWANFALLRTALVDGPLWFRDYGLYGMQYGARQLFEEAIPEFLKKDPNTQVLVSSTWANGADNFLRFFFTQQELQRVRMDGIETYVFKKQPLDESMLFVMTASEYQLAKNSPKFASVKVEKLIPYPDGTPGFYFTRLKYSDNVDAVFAAEQEARKKLVTDFVTLDGQTVELHYSPIDMGLPAYMFDGDLYTLMRGLEANPFILEFHFPQPRSVSGLTADFGLVNLTITAKLYPPSDGGEATPVTFNQTFLNSSGSSAVEMAFQNPPEKVITLRLEILNIQSGETANIHIRELHLLP
jgi:hypothetical protein